MTCWRHLQDTATNADGQQHAQCTDVLVVSSQLTPHMWGLHSTAGALVVLILLKKNGKAPTARAQAAAETASAANLAPHRDGCNIQQAQQQLLRAPQHSSVAAACHCAAACGEQGMATSVVI
jgi:hypothetical protein